MKKLLVILLAIVLAFSFVACGDETSNDGAGAGKNDPTPLDITKKEAYVGSWTKKNTTDAPFTMNITLNADGTGLMGTKTGVTWTFDESAKKITVVLNYSDGSTSEDTTATLKEDGKLYWDYDFKVKTQSGEMISVEQVVFERQ